MGKPNKQDRTAKKPPVTKPAQPKPPKYGTETDSDRI